MRRLITTVAAIALVAGSAYAQGNGKGGGQGGGGQGGGQGGHQSAQGGGGGGGGGKPDKAGRGQGGGGGMQAVGAPREGGGGKDRGNAGRSQGGGGGNGGEARGNSGQGGGNDREARGNGGGSRGNQAVGAPREGGGSKDRGNVGRGGGNDRGDAVRGGRGRGNNDVVIGRWRDADVVRINNFASVPGRGLIAGCPPGLAKKNPPCVPPGQVRSPFRGYDRPDFWGLPWLGGGRYVYDDGFLVRLGPDGRIGGYIPLLGGALAIGNVWPTYYRPLAVPTITNAITASDRTAHTAMPTTSSTGSIPRPRRSPRSQRC